MLVIYIKHDYVVCVNDVLGIFTYKSNGVSLCEPIQTDDFEQIKKEMNFIKNMQNGI